MLAKVFKNYSKRDRHLSLLLLGLITLVLLVHLTSSLLFKFKTSSSSSAYSEGLVGELQYINPLFSNLNSINQDLASLIYSGLTRYNPQSKTFEPDLATFSINEDSTKYTFTLQDNLKWQDGKPITIDDVLFTYRTVLQNPGFQNSTLRQNLEGVSIEVISDNQIQFQLSSPNSFFISQTNIGLLPKHIYQDIAINDIGNEIHNNTPNLIVGSGPYKLNKIDNLNTNITKVSLRLNKNYYNQKPTIKNMQFFLFATEEELLKNQKSLNSIPSIHINTQDKLDKKFTTEDYLLSQYTALFVNTDSPKMQNRGIRVVLKRAASSSKLLSDLPGKQPISRPFFQFEAINDITSSDTNLLKELLEDEGWELNDQGIFEKDNIPLQLNLLVQEFTYNEYKNIEFRQLVENLTDIYQEIGIKIMPFILPADQFAKELADRNFDLVLLGHSLGTDLDSFSFWHSSQATSNGLNISNYKNVATDSLLESVRTTSNIDERNELLIKINEKLVYDVPAIFLYTDKHTFAIDNKIKKRTILATYAFISDRFYDVANWELN